MKIVIASPFVRPEKGACIMRMNEFEKHFTKKGHSLTFFSPARRGVKQEKGVKRYSSRRELWSLVKKTDFDVLIGTSPPMTNSFVAMLAAKLKGKPVVLDIRDPWTYAYEGLGIYGSFNPKLLLYKLIEKVSYKLAGKIFSVTDFTSEIIERAGADRKKIVLVPNGTQPERFKCSESAGKRIRKGLGIPENSTVLLYAGSFAGKNLGEMIEVLEQTLKKKDFRLLLLLAVEEKNRHELAKLKKTVESKGLKGRTTFLDITKIPKNDIYKYFSASDIGLNPLPDAMDYCIPAKTYDYLACGLQVATKGPERGALKNFIEKHKAGNYSQSWTGFIKNLEKLPKRPKRKRETAKAAAKKFDRKISSEIALEHMAFLLKK